MKMDIFKQNAPTEWPKNGTVCVEPLNFVKY